eukprot:GHVT01012695.1.p1 GENE.GHVT01012695.1~~GHVT01012695.1.p1  ORF type:complete len:360 (+),score=72.00 GHVT01012695.1:166-1245(+)
MEGFEIHCELSRCLVSIVLASDLQLCYLVSLGSSVSPYFVDWGALYSMLPRLKASDSCALHLLDLPLERLALAAKNVAGGAWGTSASAVATTFGADTAGLQRCKKLHVALILLALVQGLPVELIASTFKVNRGHIQQLQQTATSAANMVATLCERLGWWMIAPLLKTFIPCLRFGVQPELLGLMQLPQMNAKLARILYDQCDVRSLAALSVPSVVPSVERALSRGFFSDCSGDTHLEFAAAAAREIHLQARIFTRGAREAAKDADAEMDAHPTMEYNDALTNTPKGLPLNYPRLSNACPSSNAFPSIAFPKASAPTAAIAPPLSQPHPFSNAPPAALPLSSNTRTGLGTSQTAFKRRKC